MSDRKKTTIAQEELINELVQTYGLDPEQIGFDGESLEPILDFEALCVLRERLTNFKCVDVSRVSFDQEAGEATATCIIANAEGREITVSDFAQIGEAMPDGSKVSTSIQAKRLARARAMRSGIRAAGVNLMKAHKYFIEHGNTLDFQPIDVRETMRKELHALAGEIGFINGSDRSKYEKHIAELFDGRTSSSDLNDIERGQLRVSLRAIRNELRSRNAATDKVAA